MSYGNLQSNQDTLFFIPFTMFYSKYKVDRMLKEQSDKMTDKYNQLLRENKDECYRQITRSDQALQTKEFELKRFFVEQELEIKKETSKLQEVITKLTIEKGILDSENKILNKAFENLGFDVSDMKDILDSLVKGLISKNTISLISPSNGK